MMLATTVLSADTDSNSRNCFQARFHLQPRSHYCQYWDAGTVVMFKLALEDEMKRVVDELALSRHSRKSRR